MQKLVILSNYLKQEKSDYDDASSASETANSNNVTVFLIAVHEL